MTTLTLGTFRFARYEIPESLPFGASQKINTHTLVGGTKVIDVLGRIPVNPSWSGFFQGQEGFNRARYLENLAIAGLPLTFTYSEFSYQVLITEFKAEFRSGPFTPYTISLEVIADNTKPITVAPDAVVEDLVNDDLATGNGLSATVNDATLTSLMGTLTSAVSAVGSFANASASIISGLQMPIGAALAQVTYLTNATNAVLGSVGGVAGIVGGGDPYYLATTLTGQISAAQMAPNLANLTYTLGRMSTNIATMGSGSAKLAVGGGNLFAIASEQYGDPMAWTALAQANHITDPQISGITTLIIPPAPNQSSGGVLNA